MIPTVDELNDSNSCNVKPQNDISRRDISSSKSTFVSLTAKWGKERIDLNMLSAETTIGKVKEMLTEKTGVLPKRQKLIGLSLKSKTAGAKLMDENVLSDLKVKSGKKNLKSSDGHSNNNCVFHQFILMGTPEDKIFIDPNEKDDLPDVIDDFDLDFNAGSDEVCTRNYQSFSIFFLFVGIVLGWLMTR